nr:uncharacterized protein LOC112208648 [Pan troglodytes]
MATRESPFVPESVRKRSTEEEDAGVCSKPVSPGRKVTGGSYGELERGEGVSLNVEEVSQWHSHEKDSWKMRLLHMTLSKDIKETKVRPRDEEASNLELPSNADTKVPTKAKEKGNLANQKTFTQLPLYFNKYHSLTPSPEEKQPAERPSRLGAFLGCDFLQCGVNPAFYPPTPARKYRRPVPFTQGMSIFHLECLKTSRKSMLSLHQLEVREDISWRGLLVYGQ